MLGSPRFALTTIIPSISTSGSNVPPAPTIAAISRCPASCLVSSPDEDKADVLSLYSEGRLVTLSRQSAVKFCCDAQQTSSPNVIASPSSAAPQPFGARGAHAAGGDVTFPLSLLGRRQ